MAPGRRRQARRRVRVEVHESAKRVHSRCGVKNRLGRHRSLPDTSMLSRTTRAAARSLKAHAPTRPPPPLTPLTPLPRIGSTGGYFVSIKSATLPALVIDLTPCPDCNWERLVLSMSSLGYAQEICVAIRSRMQNAMEQGAVTGAVGYQNPAAGQQR